jgi:polynucleotide 5'-kinase involved in rRNA processing
MQAIPTDLKNSGFPSAVFSRDGMRLLCSHWQGPIYVFKLENLVISPPAKSMRRYVNAKVVLLGEGAVGKTSLAYRLIEDKYVVKDRTHGMNV